MRFLRNILGAGLALAWLATSPVHAQTQTSMMGCCAMGQPAAVAGGGFTDPGSLGAKVPFWFGSQYGATVHTTGSTVDTWDNKGSLGGSLVVPPGGGSGGHPTLLSAALNGHNVISGDGIGNVLAMTGISLPSASNVSVFIVFRRTALTGGNYDYLFSYSGGASQGVALVFTASANLWWSGGDQLVGFANGYNNGGPRFGVTSADFGLSVSTFYHLQAELGASPGVTRNGSSLTSYDNTAGGVNAISGEPFGVFATVSGPGSNPAFGNYSPVDIAEILLCYDCTSGDKANINTYLTAQWGLWFFPGFFYRRGRVANDNDAVQHRRAA